MTSPRDLEAEAEAYARATVRRAGTSFDWAMRTLPKRKRAGLYAVYTFCREIDDTADGPEPRDVKLRLLDDWRGEVKRLFASAPRRPATRALVGPVAAFGLPRAEFETLIDGMEMDARGDMMAPTSELLGLYCRRVAGAVGLLTLRIFGCTSEAAREFALALGEALQLTNILRDLGEDAALGRLYLPEDVLQAANIEARTPAGVLADPALAAACQALAARAEERFEAARAHAHKSACLDGGYKRLRPAIVMMAVYRRVLARLARRGWSPPESNVRLGAAEKLWIAVRHILIAAP